MNDDALRAPAAGFLITFEGGEGSGKSTQVELLAVWLGEQGHDVLTAREPGTTATGELARRFLLETAPDDLTPEAELALFLAARAQLAEEVLRPALAAGRVVLLDRYGDSSVAYQGYGRGLEPGRVAALNGWATRGLAPALTVLIDVPVTAAEARRDRAPDRVERAGVPFHERVHAGYAALARAEPNRFCVLDGRRPIAEIQATIRDRVRALLNTERTDRGMAST
ncbi:MAG: dTMP kinase [Gemmatimonadota bacterium]